jgi:hypothetical protein
MLLSGSSIYTPAIQNHSDLIGSGTKTHAEIDTFLNSKGLANGITPLDATGKVPLTHLPTISGLGSLKYCGVYDANTNTPNLFLVPGQPEGCIYIVSVAGTQDLNGISAVNYGVGDWIIRSPTKWETIEDSQFELTNLESKTQRLDTQGKLINTLPVSIDNSYDLGELNTRIRNIYASGQTYSSIFKGLGFVNPVSNSGISIDGLGLISLNAYQGTSDNAVSLKIDGTIQKTAALITATGNINGLNIAASGDVSGTNISANQAIRTNDWFNLSNTSGINLGNNAAGIVRFRGTNYKGPGYLIVDANGVISVERIYPEELTFDASLLTAGALTVWNNIQNNYSLATVTGNVTVTAGGVNGLNTVDFGLDTGISSTVALFPWKDFTVHMVVNIASVLDSSTFWSSGNYGDPSALVAWSLGSNNYVHDSAGHIPLGNNIGGMWQVLTWVKQSGSSPHITCYRNGSQIGANDFIVNPVTTIDGFFALGRNPGTNIGGSPISVGEVRVFRKTQSGVEVNTNLDQLISKWIPAEEVKLDNTTNGSFVSYPKINFRDSGGLPANYGPNENYTISFDAGSTTRSWRMTPVSFEFEEKKGNMTDRLGIQTSPDGSTWTNISLVGFNSSDTAVPPWSQTIVPGDGWIFPATSVGSPLTGVSVTFTTRFVRFIFISDGGTQLTGWDLEMLAIAI